jgi:putative sterol carrier protein
MEGISTGTQGVGPEGGELKPAPGLEGLTGRLRLDVGNQAAAVLEVQDGEARLLPADGEADAVVIAEDVETIHRFQRGELNPVVASLQGKLRIAGNLAFAIKVILGLQVAHPFSQEV